MIPARHALQRIGLLGGSFNPAHEGHREISLAALSWLALDAVWWLVSPGNPLKTSSGYAPYEVRLAQARRVAQDSRIVISNFEQRKDLQYTVDTLAMLEDLWPQIRFVWLMGADGLFDFHRWKDWKRIAMLAPMAVFNRPGSETAPEDSVAGKELSAFRLQGEAARGLADAEPPAWAFFPATKNPASATALRAKAARIRKM
jgi:nicotinate-nucleotide adenylyltransferase